MRILTTGGTGFIGAPTVRHLLASGHEVVLAAYPGELGRIVVPNGVTVIPADLYLQKDRSNLLDVAAADAMLHMAWYAEPNNFWHSEKNLDWLAISLELIKGFLERGGSRLVVSGTCAEYDWSAGGRMVENSTPLAPKNLYGVCKNALREVVEAYSRSRGFSYAWGRVFWPYGPGEPPGRLVSTLFSDLLSGKPCRCNSGNLWRDYLHVEDIGAAFAALMASPLQGAINIGSGEAVSLAELSRKIACLVGRPELMTLGEVEPSPGNPETVQADVDRLFSELGWRPKLSLDEGLAMTLMQRA